QVEVTESNRHVEETVENRLIKGSITVKKVDEDSGVSLDGAVFGLYDSEGKLVDSQETKNGGVAKFEGLLPGTYSLKESKAPDGYEMLDLPKTVTVGEGANRHVEVTIENKLVDIAAILTGYPQCIREGDTGSIV